MYCSLHRLLAGLWPLIFQCNWTLQLPMKLHGRISSYVRWHRKITGYCPAALLHMGIYVLQNPDNVQYQLSLNLEGWCTLLCIFQNGSVQTLGYLLVGYSAESQSRFFCEILETLFLSVRRWDLTATEFIMVSNRFKKIATASSQRRERKGNRTLEQLTVSVRNCVLAL